MKAIAPIFAALLMMLAASARAETATTQPAAATRPSDQPKRVEISASIDGSDELHITPNGLTWQHKLWDWPTDVTINGQAWDPHDPMPLDQLGVGLTKADLSAERVTVISREARDTLAVEASEDGIVVYFADSPAGGDTYRVTLEFGPEQHQHATQGPTTKP